MKAACFLLYDALVHAGQHWCLTSNSRHFLCGWVKRKRASMTLTDIMHDRMLKEGIKVDPLE